MPLENGVILGGKLSIYSSRQTVTWAVNDSPKHFFRIEHWNQQNISEEHNYGRRRTV
jgi:hypothetical protein